ncbi:Inosine-5'-monophosphate dehydrogenase [Linum grandiflorum]
MVPERREVGKNKAKYRRHLFNHGYSYTDDDVIFLPHYIDFPTDAVSLSCNIRLSIPCLSSLMGIVTESAMAALGDIGIVHYNTTPSAKASSVRSVKSRCVPLMSSPIFFSTDSRIINEFKTPWIRYQVQLIPADSSLLTHLATIWIRLILTCNAAGEGFCSPGGRRRRILDLVTKETVEKVKTSIGTRVQSQS